MYEKLKLVYHSLTEKKRKKVDQKKLLENKENNIELKISRKK